MISPSQRPRKVVRLRPFILLLSLSFAATPLASAQQYTIATVAGGVAPPSGVPATLAAIGNTIGVALDASGNLYFSSSIGCVFKVDTSGQLTRVAGTGLDSGTTTDGGQATSAKLMFPAGLAIDSSGNLYIADFGDNRVRKVAANGIISTFAGTGTEGYSGDGVPAASAQLTRPAGLAIDSAGNVFIADSGNDMVRKISTNGVITTVAGNGYSGYYGDGSPAVVASLSTPLGVAVDSSGNLFIADHDYNVVRKVSAAGIISTVAGTTTDGFSGDGSAAINATLSAPQSVATGPGGVLYIADTGNGRIRKIDSAGNISTVAGNGSARYTGDGVLATTVGLAPGALLIDTAGNIDVADETNNGIRQVSTAGIIATVAGNGQFDIGGDGANAANARFESTALAVSPAGALYIADAANDDVRVVTTDGTIQTFAGQEYGGPPTSGVQAIDAKLVPQNIATDSAQNVYVNNSGDTVEITPSGAIVGDLAGQNVQGVDAAGNIYTFNSDSGPVIQQISPTQSTVTAVGGGTEYYNCSSSPVAAGLIQLGWVTAMAVSPGGNIYYSQFDSFLGEPNYCVFEVSGGIVSVVAGNGQSSYTGDGGAATAAQLLSVDALAADSLGRLYIADSSHVRMVSSNGIINTIAGNGTVGSTGDGGSATDAEITPLSLAAGPQGTVYVGQKFAVRILIPPANTTVTNVTSANSNGTYGAGASIAIQVIFSAPVVVNGSPQLVLNSGGTATYSAGSGTNTLTFTYVVANGQSASHLDYNSTSALLLNGGSVVDAFANAVSLTLTAPGSAGSLSANRNIVVNTAAASFTVSGQVTLSGQPLPGVSVTLSDGASALTNASGSFSFTGLTSGATYTVTPAYSGFTIAPGSETFTNLSGNQTANFAASAIQGALTFVPITPCRVVDTRNPSGAFGGPILGAGATREFLLPGGACNLPSSAEAYSLNVTAVPSGPLGYLTIFPAGQTQPLVSTLNSDGRVKANATIVPAGLNGGVNLFVSDPTHVIIDVNGYFVPAGTSSSLSFYPLTPCRIVDTRAQTGPLGGPSLPGGSTRSFPVLSSSCGIPSSAQAYSVNFTALPRGPLGFMTTWPAGQSQPLVSTLNASTGAVTANAAILPAGSNGAISVMASDSADLLIDVNGYFAAPAAGGLALYTVTPCRVADTRFPTGSPAFEGTTTAHIAGGSCTVPSAARAFVVNATVVPVQSLGWLTLWPDAVTQPGASTLNAYDGAVTSNMAIVPTTDGILGAYAANPTYLILDLSGYFAP